MEDNAVTNIEQDIDGIIKESKKFRFQLELSQTTDLKKKELLEKIIKNMESYQLNTHPDKFKNIIQEFNNKVYFQSWAKLKLLHKQDRIKIYVEEKFKDEQKLIKDQILKLLLEKCEAGYLNKKENVEYDSLKGKIINIIGLIKNEENNIYEFETPKLKKKIIIKSKAT